MTKEKAWSWAGIYSDPFPTRKVGIPGLEPHLPEGSSRLLPWPESLYLKWKCEQASKAIRSTRDAPGCNQRILKTRSHPSFAGLSCILVFK